MAKPDQQNDDRFNPEQMDEIRNLYIGRIRDAQSTLQSESEGESTVTFNGEILVYGQSDGQRLYIEQVRRIALVGNVTSDNGRERFGRLSLIGPGVPHFVPPGSEGESSDLFFSVYSRELTTSRFENNWPLEGEGDAAYFPILEEASATLIWQPGESDSGVNMTLSMQMGSVNHLNTIRRLDVDVRNIEFNPVNVEMVQAEQLGEEILFIQLNPNDSPQPAMQLAASGEIHMAQISNVLCEEPEPCLSPNPSTDTVTRCIGLRFINVSSTDHIAQIGFDQLRGICQIWRNKAALNLFYPVQIARAEAVSVGLYGMMTTDLHHSLGQDPALPSYGGVRVFVVDAMFDDNSNPDVGGGIAHNCGTAEAYIILALPQMAANPHLLAHELGHAIGLSHPNQQPYPGSDNSILTSSGADVNPEFNTLWNCRIFTVGNDGKALSPLVFTSENPNCFRPDPEQ